MPTLNASGADIHYQVLGEGPAIVMIHGLLLGNMATWYFGAAASLAKSHRVIVYDLRGHGMSGKAKEGYNLLTMVEDLRQLLDHEDVSESGCGRWSWSKVLCRHRVACRWMSFRP
ncbi:MAG: alpha/beta hydrolase [Proteobacteria bacterium]|nr:MAG: alpha/beta hydrolase [Pseudomonadota bacterium]